MAAKYIVLALFLNVLTVDRVKAEQDSKQAFSFVVIGHIRGPDNGKMYYLLDELIAEIDKLKPDMVFLTGDMIYGDQKKPMADPAVIVEDWEQLDAAMGQLGVPIYRVAGNHDVHDGVTRDIYYERYGKLPQAFSYRDSRFILLNTALIPEGNDPQPPLRLDNVFRKQLAPEQIDFIRSELSEDNAYDNVFLFMHHLLWWDQDGTWWSDVHPLLVDRNVRAVFGGDRGPIGNFSHMQRNGIDYVQSVVQGEIPIEKLRAMAKEADGYSMNFGTFLHVTAEGSEVEVAVKTVGAMSSTGFSPEVWHQVMAGQGDEKSLIARIWDIIGRPRRLLALAGLMLVCFMSGVLVTSIWKRRHPKST